MSDIKTKSIEIVAPLGPSAFSEISGEVVNVSLCILRNTFPSPTRSVVFLDNAITRDSTETKSQTLRDARRNMESFGKYIVQDTLSKVPSCNMGVYWLPETLFNLLSQDENYLDNIFAITKGLKTGQDKRFVRFFGNALI